MPGEPRSRADKSTGDAGGFVALLTVYPSSARQILFRIRH